MMEKVNILIVMGNVVEEIKVMCKYEMLLNEEYGVVYVLYKYVM